VDFSDIQLRLEQDERVLNQMESIKSSGCGDKLLLTNRRLLLYRQETRLFLFPGGRSLAAARLLDTDAVFAGKKYLPSWLLILGVIACVYGLVASRLVPHFIPARVPGRPLTLPPWTSFDLIGLLALAVGILLVIAWFTYSNQVMEFKVSGDPHFIFGFSTFGSTWNDVRDFIAGYNDAKREADFGSGSPPHEAKNDGGGEADGLSASPH
jgi:hypothetical protein